MKFLLSCAVLCCIALAAAPANARLFLETVAADLTSPSFITSPPDDASRLVIPGLGGDIRIMKDGVLQEQPFLDVSEFVLSGEQDWGFYGFAFHPDFLENGYFFVSYLTRPEGVMKNEVYRYRVFGNPATSLTADPTTRTQILSILQPWEFHHGGHLAFSPVDDYLYYMSADNDDHYAPRNDAQDLSTIYGKMLRINVDGALPYTIPNDNPYVGVDGVLPEIWSYGHRNPWRFSFDRLTGDLWLGDVGQWLSEEINFQAATSNGGENFGWNVFESSRCVAETTPIQTCEQLLSSVAMPVYEYEHTVGNSVTGGYVYRGASVPQLQGQYLFADFARGRVFSLNPVTKLETELSLVLDPNQDMLRQLVSFGEDANGELYLVSMLGTVWRFSTRHDADQNGDLSITLAELLRVIQFFNLGGYGCGTPGMVDGYFAGPGSEACAPHTADNIVQDWKISLQELLRVIQLFNTGGYSPCAGQTADGFCALP